MNLSPFSDEQEDMALDLVREAVRKLAFTLRMDSFDAVELLILAASIHEDEMNDDGVDAFDDLPPRLTLVKS